LREAPYDERFREYGGDDIELGYRLFVTRGLRLTFLKAAQVAHLHPFTFDDAMRRVRSCGYVEHRMNHYWPATRYLGGTGWKFAIARLLSRREKLLDGLTRIAAGWIGEKAAGKLGVLLLQSHFYRGYQEYPEGHG
jgi:hypothetical protein